MSRPTRRRIHPVAAIGLVACSLAWPAAAAAAGANKRPALDPDFPVRLEDAYPVSYRTGYFKLVSTYARATDGTDTTQVQPEVAYGFAPRFDVHLSSTYLVGDGDRGSSGDLNLNAQYLIVEEQRGAWYPAVAFEATLLFPTGVGSDGLDVGGQLNLTKTLVWAPTWDALHLNLTYQRNFIPAAGEREASYVVVAGYTRRLAADFIFLTDFYWELPLAAHQSTQAVEVGLIKEFGEHVRLAGGFGVGLGDDSPDFTATVGITVTN